jgi:hypothetical protein
VVGEGINPNGQTEAWLANLAPIPEPSSVALAGLGMTGLIGYGWRKRRRVCATHPLPPGALHAPY